MQQTKYCTNVIITSVYGKKKRLMKQMPPNMKHIILAKVYSVDYLCFVR